MKTFPLPRVSALALLLSALFVVAAYAGDDSGSNRSLRERISADISAGLPRTHSTPLPHVLTSKPATLHAKASTPAPVTDHVAEATAASRDTTPEGAWNELLAGNKRFIEDHPRVRPLTRERVALAGGQHPRVIVLGCADSRVSPELVFDQSLGDVFVVRTAGNIVDPIALGSIEYAVEHLHAQLLVVLGHTSCGAVKAAAGGGEMPSSYLQAIVDRIRPTVQRLSNCFEGDELVERSVIANSRQSAADVLSNSTLIREAVSKGELKVMSAVYDLHGGIVTAVSVPAATAEAKEPVH